ncbi:growth-blocking peptide 3 [Musca autumnalis]|uniref:growth-blocking peptide 3 n=1 Tax=Musca autumnalis TaxID=221902 RepID=UPI003CF9C16D
MRSTQITMSKATLLFILSLAVLAALANCDTTTTSVPDTQTTTLAPHKPGYIIANNIPELEPGCEYQFKCKKKLLNAELPKPCLKTCVDGLTCNQQKKSIRKGFYCVEFNEELVDQEYQAEKAATYHKASPVAMIDFPCQPGYLPDSRGRCREVW